MLRRMLVTVGFVSIALTAADTAQSGPVTFSHSIRVMEFERASGVLIGYPGGVAPPAWYVHTPHTLHLPIHLPPEGVFHHWPGHGPDHGAPPNPCHELAILWNANVEFMGRFPQLSVDHVNVFQFLLADMATAECTATVAANAGDGSPTPIVAIAPTGH